MKTILDIIFYHFFMFKQLNQQNNKKQLITIY